MNCRCTVELTSCEISASSIAFDHSGVVGAPHLGGTMGIRHCMALFQRTLDTGHSL